MFNRYSQNITFGAKKKAETLPREKKCDISCNCCHGINILNKIIFSHKIPQINHENYVIHLSPLKVNL